MNSGNSSAELYSECNAIGRTTASEDMVETNYSRPISNIVKEHANTKFLR